VGLSHAASGAQALIEWIQKHPIVDQVLYPALRDFPGHAIWKRDFLGASGVFSVVFKPAAAPHLAAALDILKTFAIGPSWGGTRSLTAPIPVKQHRSACSWTGVDPVLRISVGLEDLSDLRADIENLFVEIAARMG